MVSSSKSIQPVLQTDLRTKSITLPGILMQALASIAPAAGLIFGVDTIAGLAGQGGTIWAFIIGALILMLVAVSVIQLTKRLSSAGGYFTWASHILGPRPGFFTGWLFFVYAPLVAGVNFAFMGGVMESSLQAAYNFTLPWWIPAVIGVVAVFFLQYFGIQISIKTLVWFGMAEILICVALGLSGLFSAGAGGINALPFDFRDTSGFHGIYLAIVFSIMTFSGFESVATLAEESREPRRILPRAVLLSLLIMLAFYLIVPFGIFVGWGTKDFSGFVANSSPVFAFAHRIWKGAWIILLLAFVNSEFAVALAASNASTRVFYGMGRTGALPSVFAKSHPRHRTPTGAIITQAAITGALLLGGGLALGAVNTYIYFAIPITLAIIVIYCIGNIASWRLYRTEFRQDFNPVTHLVCPVVACVVMVYVAYKTIIPLPTGVFHSSPFFFFGWLVIGIAVTFIAGRKGRDWMTLAGQLVFEEEVANPRGTRALLESPEVDSSGELEP